MKKFIVTTTINPPTEAIRKFDAMEGWELIVIGDQKTPKDYKLERGTYVNPATQESLFPDLSAAIGWNCIQRRNLGFVMAHQLGADIVATIDDDNIPLPGWGENLLIGRRRPETGDRVGVECHQWHCRLPAFDPISCTTEAALWHRGYPLPLVAQRARHTVLIGRGEVAADIQADFWNGDPDVDAFCRMEHAPNCTFHDSHFPLAGDKPSPFNSQNTFLTAAVLPHYFMMCGVGRMDDIWASYHVQAQGFKVIYGKASVRQDRNGHDLIKDMKGEYLGYEHNLAIVNEILTNKNVVLAYLSAPARRAFEIYQSYF